MRDSFRPNKGLLISVVDVVSRFYIDNLNTTMLLLHVKNLKLGALVDYDLLVDRGHL